MENTHIALAHYTCYPTPYEAQTLSLHKLPAKDLLHKTHSQPLHPYNLLTVLLKDNFLNE